MSHNDFGYLSSLYSKNELFYSKICLGVVSTLFAITIGIAFEDEWLDEDTALPIYLILKLAALCYAIELYRYFSKASLVNRHVQSAMKYSNSNQLDFDYAMKRKSKVSLFLFFVEFLFCYIMFIL